MFFTAKTKVLSLLLTLRSVAKYIVVKLKFSVKHLLVYFVYVCVFILQLETQHVLQGDINKESLTNFLIDYASDNLPRWHRTSSVKPRTDGFSFGPTQTIHLSRYREVNPHDCQDNMVCVEELSYSNFKSKVLENKKVSFIQRF